MGPFVIISHQLPEQWLSSLTGHCQWIAGPEGIPGLAPALRERLPEAIGLFTLLTDRVDESILENAPHLKVVSNMAVGVDNIDLAACSRRGIPVGNTPDVLTDGTADLAMALLLSAARKLPVASSDARAGLWKTWSPTGWLGADLNGAVLGIVGMGKIGRAVANRAAAFGMNIIYHDPNPISDSNSVKALRVSFNDLLIQSDFISIHTPLTLETHQLINKDTLRKMKPSAILINTARGPIVDTEALILALNEGWITAAALDVTDPEPLPATHPLYKLPNCLIVPHIGSATYGTRQRMAERACVNLLAGLAGQKLPFCVNPEVYQTPS